MMFDEIDEAFVENMEGRCIDVIKYVPYLLYLTSLLSTVMVYPKIFRYSLGIALAFSTET